MVSIEELKEQFEVDQTGRIVIPILKFDSSWDKELLELGYECHANNNKVVVTRFETGAKKPVRARGIRPDSWTKEEIDLLIKLWNQKDLTKKEIAKRFPNRNECAITNKLARLRNSGKIKGRWKARKTKEREAKRSAKKLPSRDKINTKFLELVNAKKYKEAAKLAVCYSLVKVGPEKVAEFLREAVVKWRVCQLIQKRFNCSCGGVPPFCSLVDELTCVTLKSTDMI